jgi:hypothetical protein
MIPEFSAAVQSVKVLKDVLAAAHELKDSTALTAAVNEVHGKLVIAYENVINSQEKRLAAQQQITELEQKIAAIMNWKQEAERYERGSLPLLLSQIARTESRRISFALPASRKDKKAI